RSEKAEKPSSSRIQLLHSPARPLARVQVPYVQSARHVLPELDSVRRHAESGPVRRSRNGVAGEALLHLGNTMIQLGGRRHRLALQRRPGTNLASPRSPREVCVGLGGRHRTRRPLDAHLHLERLPMEAERGTLGAEKLASLSALEVRVEDESRFLAALKKDDAHAGVAAFVHRAERERRRLGKNVPWKRLGLL